uniref:Ig-like domain-containing protein n=1 Tax=Cyprinus carpio TaxID=7962 RepID=A0A8C2IVJ2_CYPCA
MRTFYRLLVQKHILWGQVANGDNFLVDCVASGLPDPEPEFLWILPNGTAMSPGMKLQWFFHYLGNGTLHIMQTGVIDKGVYQCLAKNVAGQAEKRYALEPGQKPHIRSTTLNMPCNADGCPQATIIWTLPNGLVLDKAERGLVWYKCWHCGSCPNK